MSVVLVAQTSLTFAYMLPFVSESKKFLAYYIFLCLQNLRAVAYSLPACALDE